MDTLIVSAIITIVIICLVVRSTVRSCKIEEFIINVYLTKQLYTLYCDKFDSTKYTEQQNHFHSYPSFIGSKEELGREILKKLSEVSLSDSLKSKCWREDFIDAVKDFERMELSIKYDIWFYTEEKI